MLPASVLRRKFEKTAHSVIVLHPTHGLLLKRAKTMLSGVIKPFGGRLSRLYKQGLVKGPGFTR
jgi:hypothetical protein